MTVTAISDYVRLVDQAHRAGNDTEHTHRPALKALVESVLAGVTATNEPRREECGAPDYVVSRNTRHGPLTIGYIEAKSIGESLDQAEQSEQLDRYRKSLDNLILTDYLEFRWYVNGEQRQAARLARVGADRRLKPEQWGPEAVAELLAGFLAREPEEITSPRVLAERMARLTHMVRDIIVEAFRKDRASDTLADLRKAFAQALIPELDQPDKAAEFADMYAQTIAYGLFAAACNHTGPGPFQRLGAATDIPKTNPFLRRLFETITGTELDDEPYAGFVDDLVQLLGVTDIGAILEDFGTRTRRSDPVVHFYETFLSAYDPQVRERRGVYYTPEPVVSYMVRSVDWLLRERFDCAQGLADTGEVEYQRRTNGEMVTDKCPRLLILDPACGTGTFLYSVVDHIREQFAARRDAGTWSGYVKNHLLPRLFGFELLMAPYAVAHLKLGMQLAAQDRPAAERDTWAYDFAGADRLGVYLTNTLQEAEQRAQTLFGPLRIISEEANAAAWIKRDLPIMVVMGNPPYSGHSANRSWEIKAERKNGRIVKKRVPTFIGKLVRDYFFVDGAPLDEKNPKWLQDDYVKFVRWGQWRIEKTGAGVLAFITNHGYLDNPTFRGMRQSLMNSFDEIYLYDLHGNSKKKERAPDGSPDKNVFDIQQGVAIGIFVRRPNHSGPAKVFHADLYGTREHKYSTLAEEDVTATRWRELEPAGPHYTFRPGDGVLRAEYEAGWKLTEVVPVNSAGVVTARDHFAVQWTPDALLSALSLFVSLPPEEARTRFDLGPDARDWKVELAQEDVRQHGTGQELVAALLYRPFDTRYTYYSAQTRGVICMPRSDVMRHLLRGPNMALVVPRRVETAGSWRHCLATRLVADHVAVSLKSLDSVFPLYGYPRSPKGSNHALSTTDGTAHGERSANLAPDFTADISHRIGLIYVPDGLGDLKTTFGPEDVFHYIYAVFHAPTYRSRYAEFLKADFPRVPLTSDPDLFRRLCAFGAEITALHLLESPLVADPAIGYPLPGNNTVGRGFPRYAPPGEAEPGTGTTLEAGRVYINERQHFRPVDREVWDFHVGGYQVCEKWLKDRRGRVLSYDELLSYKRIVVALCETIRLMDEVDAAIPEWPIT